MVAIKTGKRVCLFIAAALLLMFPNTLAAGQIPVSVSYDTETMQIFVSGKSPDSANQWVSILLLKEGVEPSQLTDQQLSEKAAGYRHVLCSDTGAYKADFLMKENAEKGKYFAWVTDEAGRSGSGAFPYASVADITNALQQVKTEIAKGKDNAQGVQRTIEQYEVDLLLDFSEYERLSQPGKLLVSGLLISQSPAGGFQGITDFTAAYKKAVATIAVREAEQNGILDILEKYQAALGIDLSQYEKQNEQAKAYALTLLSQQKAVEPAELQSGFMEAVICGAVSKPVNYKEIREAMFTSYSAYLGLSSSAVATFNGLSAEKQDQVFRSMLDEDYKSYSEINSGFVRAVNNAASAGGTGGGSNGGGNGGGGDRKDYGEVSGGFPQPTPTPTEKPVFADLDGVAWAKDSITSLYQKGVINGYGDGDFRPEGNVSREEFIKMITVALNINTAAVAPAFVDVQETDWAYPYISAGVENGLINGYEDGSFRGGDSIRREDMALIMGRVLNQYGITQTSGQGSGFADETAISDYCRDSVRLLKAKGIVTGDEAGRFRPADHATRAETAVMIDRLLRLVAE